MENQEKQKIMSLWIIKYVYNSKIFILLFNININIFLIYIFIINIFKLLYSILFEKIYMNKFYISLLNKLSFDLVSGNSTKYML